jgi:SOS response regulatory protein OraA/RecX
MRKVSSDVDEIFNHAVKLLAGRDYTVARLREKLAGRHGPIPEEVIQWLIAKRYLNDRRYAEAYVATRKKRGARRLQEELVARGITPELASEAVSVVEWPSLRGALKVKMADWNLHAPLQPRDVARLFRALARLGYEEDAIREDLEQLHEQ